MALWKKIFKKGQTTSLSNKIFKEGKTTSLSGEFKVCLNCGRCSIKIKENICTQCGHDQRVPIEKKITTSREMAQAAAKTYVAFGNIDELLGDRVKDIDKSKKDQICSIVCLTDLSLQFILYDAHYQCHPNYNEIYHDYKIELDLFLSNLYGKEKLQEVKDHFSRLVIKYSIAFQEDNFLKAITEVFEMQVESVILDTRLPLPIPSVYAFMPYFIYISNFLLFFQCFLNRWEIR
jgi:ribosomal protein L37E